MRGFFGGGLRFNSCLYTLPVLCGLGAALMLPDAAFAALPKHDNALTTVSDPTGDRILSVRGLRRLIRDLGYREVHNIRRRGGYYVCDAYTPRGRKVRIRVDAHTGDVISVRRLDRDRRFSRARILLILASVGYNRIVDVKYFNRYIIVRCYDRRGRLLVVRIDAESGRIVEIEVIGSDVEYEDYIDRYDDDEPPEDEPFDEEDEFDGDEDDDPGEDGGEFEDDFEGDPAEDGVPFEEIRGRLIRQGYSDVELVKQEDDVYIVRARDARDRLVELKIDAFSGRIMSSRRVDDSEDYGAGDEERGYYSNYRLVRMLESRGYDQVRIVETKDRIVVCEAYDEYGRRVRLRIDRRTARIIERKYVRGDEWVTSAVIEKISHKRIRLMLKNRGYHGIIGIRNVGKRYRVVCRNGTGKKVKLYLNAANGRILHEQKMPIGY